MKLVKAVLFDLDDTLWPIIPVIMRAEVILFDWLREHAPGVARAHSIETLREHRKAMAATDPCYAYHLQKLRHAALCDVFQETGEDIAKVELAMQVFNRARNLVTTYDDVHPVLSALQPLVALGSISNGSADLEAIGMTQYFGVSLAAHQYGCAKPDPAIYHAACEQLGVDASQAIYVGDDPLLDVEGAQHAGLQGIWLNRGGVDPDRALPAHVRPDAIFTSLHELEAWLTGRIIRIEQPAATTISSHYLTGRPTKLK